MAAWGQVNRSPIALSKLVMRIDHVPIVVRDLEAARHFWGDVLQFTIKPGKVHEGIHNFFVKFPDGTYLEFITPVDSTAEIGRYYTHFLRQRAGGTSLALSVTSADSVMRALQQHHIRFDSSANPVWTSIEPQGADLFYIHYNNKNWKERATYTTHPNQSLALTQVWWIAQQPSQDIEHFTQLGLRPSRATSKLAIKVQALQAGTNQLTIITPQQAQRITRLPDNTTHQGIRGFSIEVKSLQHISTLIQQKPTVTHTDYLMYEIKDNNLFLLFHERQTP